MNRKDIKLTKNNLTNAINNSSDNQIIKALQKTEISIIIKALYGLNEATLMKVLKVMDKKLVKFLIEDLTNYNSNANIIEIEESQQKLYQKLISS